MSAEVNAARWQQIAIDIGDSVFKSVNTSETVGSTDETGYILMFFNKARHGGKSTFVSSLLDKKELKQLLREAIRQLDGPRSKIVEPPKFSN